MRQYLYKAFNEQMISQELKNENSQFYFAYVKNDLAGYIKINTGSAQTEPHKDPALEVERIYVLQPFQGQKVGQQLLGKALQIAKKHKAQYVWLGVWEHNHRAFKFYQKLGFVKFGQHPFMLGQDRQTDHLMKLMLH